MMNISLEISLLQVSRMFCARFHLLTGPLSHTLHARRYYFAKSLAFCFYRDANFSTSAGSKKNFLGPFENLFQIFSVATQRVAFAN